MAFSAYLADELGNTYVTLRPLFLTPGTDVIACSKLDLGFPEARTVVQDRADADGVLDYTSYHGARKITADLKLFDTVGVPKVETLGLLGSLSHPSNRYYLHINRPEWDGERRMLVRPEPMGFVSDRTAGSYFEVTMAWSSPTGVLESVDQSNAYIQPGQATTIGLPAPWHAPLAIPAGLGGTTVEILNDGDLPIPFIAEIWGGCSDPVLSIGPNTLLRLNNYTIPTNSYLYVDTDAHQALINQQLSQSAYGSIDWGVSSWFRLEKGVNLLTFGASDTDENCAAYIYWRPRWLE